MEMGNVVVSTTSMYEFSSSVWHNKSSRPGVELKQTSVMFKESSSYGERSKFWNVRFGGVLTNGTWCKALILVATINIVIVQTFTHPCLLQHGCGKDLGRRDWQQAVHKFQGWTGVGQRNHEVQIFIIDNILTHVGVGESR